MENAGGPPALNHLALIVHGQNLDLPTILNENTAADPRREDEHFSTFVSEQAAETLSVRGFWDAILAHAEECDEDGILKHQLAFLADELGQSEAPLYADCEFYWDDRPSTVKAHRLIVSRAPSLGAIDIPDRILVPSQVQPEALLSALRFLYLSNIGFGGDRPLDGQSVSKQKDALHAPITNTPHLDELFGLGWMSALPRMEEHVATFFGSDKYADARVVGCGQPVPVHRVVLCGVHYFRAVLRPGSHFQRDIDGVKLVDISGAAPHLPSPEAATHAVLRFLYSNDPTAVAQPDLAQAALSVAAHLCINPVVAIAAAELARGVLEGHITPEHLPTLLLQAEEVQHWGLRSSCVRLMVDNYDAVSQLPDFPELPELIQEELQLLARRAKNPGHNADDPGVCSAAEFLAIIAEGLEEQRERLAEARERRGHCLYLGGGRGPSSEMPSTAKVEEALVRQERRISSIQSFLDSYKGLRKKRAQHKADPAHFDRRE